MFNEVFDNSSELEKACPWMTLMKTLSEGLMYLNLHFSTKLKGKGFSISYSLFGKRLICHLA